GVKLPARNFLRYLHPFLGVVAVPVRLQLRLHRGGDEAHHHLADEEAEHQGHAKADDGPDQVRPQVLQWVAEGHPRVGKIVVGIGMLAVAEAEAHGCASVKVGLRRAEGMLAGGAKIHKAGNWLTLPTMTAPRRAGGAIAPDLAWCDSPTLVMLR